MHDPWWHRTLCWWFTCAECAYATGFSGFRWASVSGANRFTCNTCWTVFDAIAGEVNQNEVDDWRNGITCWWDWVTTHLGWIILFILQAFSSWTDCFEISLTPKAHMEIATCSSWICNLIAFLCLILESIHCIWYFFSHSMALYSL